MGLFGSKKERAAVPAHGDEAAQDRQPATPVTYYKCHHCSGWGHTMVLPDGTKITCSQCHGTGHG